jgi:hypothetical protein
MAGLMDFSPGGARTLAGTGTFAGGLSMGQNGTLAPGASDASTDYGTLTASTLNLVNGSVVLGIQDAATYDRIVMTAGSGGLTLAGANKPQLTLDFANLLPNFSSLQPLNFTGLTGNWQTVSSTGAYAGSWTQSGDVWSLENVGTGGLQTLTFNQATGGVAAVPEPSTIVLLGGVAFAASVACLRRRIPR